MKEYLDFWKRGFNCKGVSTRGEFWTAWFINTMIFIVLLILAQLVGKSQFSMLLLLISGAFLLSSAIPNVAIIIRRLHDINKSWTWIFIALIPLVGAIILLVLMCSQSVEQGNFYKYTQNYSIDKS